MTIYFHNFVNQGYAAASYVRDSARAHPTAAKVAVLSIAILSSLAIAKYINVEIPTPSTPVNPGNTPRPIQSGQPPKTLLGKIEKSISEWPSRISGFCKSYWQHATSLEENWESFRYSLNQWYNGKIYDAVLRN